MLELNNKYIVSKYSEGSSITTIAKILQVSDTAIRTVLKRNKIQFRNRWCMSKKYQFNEKFFDVIDSDKKAYILGFTAADGNINPNTHAWRIKIDRKDSYILRDFLEALESNHPIGNAGTREVLEIGSVYLYNSLLKHNIVPNKTFILEWPTTIPNEFLFDYLRGFIDGDGSWLWKTSKNHPYPVLKITCASLPFLESCKAFLYKELNILPANSYNFYRNAYNLIYFGFEKCNLLYNALYKEDSLHLRRKKIKIYSLLNMTEVPNYAS